MLKYVFKRFAQLILILFGITLLSFAMMRLASYDAVDVIYENSGGALSPIAMEAKRTELGLNLPFARQYIKWLTAMLSGDMGVSYITGKKVFPLFMSKLPNTILLTVSSMLCSAVVSIPLGVLSAARKNKPSDLIIRFFCFIGNSAPNFFVSLLLLLLFSVKLKLLPVISGGSGLRGLILPTATLTIAMSSKYIRQVRTVILEEYDKDYVDGARARGVKESRILFGSALKSAMLSIITLFAVSAGSLLGGAAIVEAIFMWDGIGKLAADAIETRDYPIIQAYVMWTAFIYVGVNLAADLLYGFFNPRIKR